MLSNIIYHAWPFQVLFLSSLCCVQNYLSCEQGANNTTSFPSIVDILIPGSPYLGSQSTVDGSWVRNSWICRLYCSPPLDIRDLSILIFWNLWELLEPIPQGWQGMTAVTAPQDPSFICREGHLKPGFPGGSDDKESAHNAGNLDLIARSGRSPGEGNSNPLQSSCLENSMDKGASWATVHGLTKNRTGLSS